MTDEELISIANAACPYRVGDDWIPLLRAIAAAEREACAVRIDAMVRLCAPTERAASTVLREVAAAIRARGGK